MPSSEMHHVVPKSMGGTFTVSLCSPCHGLLHGLSDRGSHKELTARGLDKKMVVELAAVYAQVFLMGMSNKGAASELSMSKSSVDKRVNRLSEMTTEWMVELFKKDIPELTFYSYKLYNRLHKENV
jgi:hypothetical protein